MGRVKGRSIVEVGGKPVTGKNPEWTLSIERDYMDVSSFGNESKVFLVQQPTVSGTFSGLLESFDVPVGDDGVPVTLYVDKKITHAHAKILDLLGIPRPQFKMVEGQMTEVTMVDEQVDGSFVAMTVFIDPGTLPERVKRWIKAQPPRARWAIVSRLPRKVVVIDQDEWQADEYEWWAEEQHWIAVERAEYADGTEDDLW